jgi:preprotein translocase subunit SecE
VDTGSTDERHAVSEEREGAAGDAENTTRGTQTAVVARPLRPTGKRLRKTAEAEEPIVETKGGVTKDGTPTKVKTAKKPAGPSRNPIMMVVTFIRQVVAELRKVIWPSRKQMVSYTGVVIAFLVFMVALIGLVDLGLFHVMLWVFTGQWDMPPTGTTK